MSVWLVEFQRRDGAERVQEAFQQKKDAEKRLCELVGDYALWSSFDRAVLVDDYSLALKEFEYEVGERGLDVVYSLVELEVK